MAGRANSWQRRSVRVAVTALGLAVAVYLVAVHTPMGRAFESEVAVDLPERFWDWVHAGERLTHRFQAAFAAGFVLTIVATGLATRRLGRLLVVAVGTVVAVLAAWGLQAVLPGQPGLAAVDETNSFPSGHTTFATALVLGLLWLCPAPGRRRLVIASTIALGAYAVVMVTFVHRPGDVVGAMLLTLAVFAIAVRADPEAPDASGPRWVSRLVVVANLVPLAVLGLMLLRHGPELRRGAFSLPYLLALLIVLVIAGAVLEAWRALVDERGTRHPGGDGPPLPRPRVDVTDATGGGRGHGELAAQPARR